MDQTTEQAVTDTPLAERLKSIVARLEREADDRVAKRSLIEQRWLEDLRQFHGEYDDETTKRLKDAKKSQLFINKTRSKTNACEARLSDMLFPTDDKNWGIAPTPVPELADAAKAAVERTQRMVEEANRANASGDKERGLSIANQAQGAADEAKRLKAEMDEAVKRAKSMSDEIEDQLTECRYNIAAREVIRDACRIGTGTMKGPIGTSDRTRRSWKRMPDGVGAAVYQLEMVDDPRPAFVWVDPWSFFPDPDARTIEENESTFERHLLNAKQLRAYARQPGFDKEAIRRVLRSEPTKNLPTYLTDLRAISGENQPTTAGKYVCWEYRGPITAQELRDICSCLGKDQYADDYNDADPLESVCVVLWFCEGEVLKFGIHHLDSDEQIYSVYNLEKDDSSIWGYGVPLMMRDSQKAKNAAWRMMMDNAGLASGPQVEIDPNVVEPTDGDYTLTGRKVWKRKTDADPAKPGLRTHNIESHQAELANIIELCSSFIDEETNITLLAQGEQGAHTTQTKGGMTLLMNAVNVVFRRMVKNFDDDMTTPNIRRIYDWNMQFSQKEYIKGDFQVDARGTSVLLVREVQSQNLMVLANMTSHPILGLLLKAAPLVRKVVQSMMLTADEIVKTDDELRDDAERARNQPKEEDPSLAIKKEIAMIDANGRMQVAQFNRDTELIKLAEQRNMKLDELRTKLHIADSQTASKERIFAGEVAVEERAARRGAAGGSGGYISNAPKRQGRPKAAGATP